MTAQQIITTVALLLCLTLSFVLSGMEAGVFALSRLRIRRLMRSGRSSARALHGFLEKPENFLWTILVGNTLFNFAVLGWMVLELHPRLNGNRILFALVFALIVFLFYALFDLLPKMLFRAYPNRLCMFFAKPFKFVHFGLRPIVALVESCSAVLLRWTSSKAFTGRLFGNREELRQLMQDSSQGLTTEERTMISRVLDLQALTVRQIATPMEKVVMVGATTSLNDALAVARERNLARLPVWENRAGRRHIIGLVALHALLYQSALNLSRPVSEHLRPASYLEEDMRLEVALRRMQRSGQRLAVVVDPAGQETGVVSLEDILKVVFGEMQL
jgi:putative hemolysin